MLIVENLTKVYKSKGLECRALHDINFILPNTGMVFIIGKSGSGKSTLLNLIGGLDNVTSGDIVADGNRFSTFKEEDFDSYRNSYLGFVFQDFCLIDSLTVKDNIKMALDLQGREDSEKINELLELVDMVEYKNRYPVQLSGGQKQRIAIARSLVKNPKLILADEPTGNLDSKTSKQVLNTLKELSKDRLVVVVSHNLSDANEYADRIIELSDGYVIKDVEKRDEFKNGFTLDDGNLIIPNGVSLSKEELDKINESIKKGEVNKIEPIEQFVPTKPICDDGSKTTFTKKKLSFKNSIKLAVNFSKKNIISTIISVIIVTCLICLFGACQLFVFFDANKAIESVLDKSPSSAFVVQKGYMGTAEWAYDEEVDSSVVVPIDDNEIQSFYDAGYEGNIYKLYSYSFTVDDYFCDLEWTYTPDFWGSFGELYAKQLEGVLVCDMDFLNKVYGINDGNINILAGEISDKSTGLIITDFVADSYIHYHYSDNLTYEKLVGLKTHRGTIQAVIATGYKERYQEIYDETSAISCLESSKEQKTRTQKLTHSEIFQKFEIETEYYLGIGYSINPNFIDDCINDYSNRGVTNSIYDYYSYQDEETEEWVTETLFTFFWKDTVWEIEDKLDSEDHQIYLSYENYNKLFGTNVSKDDTSEFEDRYVYYTNYDRTNPANPVPLNDIYFHIVGVTGANVINDADFLELQKNTILNYRLYFDTLDNTTLLYNKAIEMDYVVQGDDFKAIFDVCEIVNIFEDFFYLIAIGLIVASALVLITYGYTNVKKRTYEIGVLRAIGGKNINIARSFIIQVLVVGIIVCLLSLLGIYLVTLGINSVLAFSFSELGKTYILQYIEILTFKPVVMVMDILCVIGVTLASAFLPILFMQKIKPINIIKAKE